MSDSRAEIACKIVAAFGCAAVLARWLEISPSTVTRWCERGIPAKWFAPILQAAREQRVAITERDFF